MNVTISPVAAFWKRDCQHDVIARITDWSADNVGWIIYGASSIVADGDLMDYPLGSHGRE